MGVPVFLAIIAPMISPLSPVRQSLRLALAAPDLAAPFGYDHLGRSLMARLAEALRLSLMVSAASALSAAAIGLALGVTASRMGGMTERLLTLLADSSWPFPAC
ncbi:hypothetical protein [Pannonibacter phragmitetus]|uniref:hypothetical protein n=1 Tax=Pannonibacter phragmitetus TaxID=121719 RepID=UPI003D2F3E8A